MMCSDDKNVTERRLARRLDCYNNTMILEIFNCDIAILELATLIYGARTFHDPKKVLWIRKMMMNVLWISVVMTYKMPISYAIINKYRGVVIFYGLAVIQTLDYFCTLGHFLVWMHQNCDRYSIIAKHIHIIYKIELWDISAPEIHQQNFVWS